MKVSITFDKEVKQSNKKQWVQQIQTLVDKLNCTNKQQKPIYQHNQKSIVDRSEKSLRRHDQNQENQVNLIGELIAMQKIMQEKFSTITKSIGKLSQKMSNVEKRVLKLEHKQQNREIQKQDFDNEFAQLSLRFERLKRESSNKKVMLQTSDTGFSYSK